MPELPEVETVRRVLEKCLVGSPITEVELAHDEIVIKDREKVLKALAGATIKAVGRRGKYFWLETEHGEFVAAHLGMSGWIRELSGSKDGTRLLSHGKAPLDDKDGNPRFLKMRLKTKVGHDVAMTDSRRFGRIWLSEGPEKDPRIKALSADVLDDTPSGEQIHKWFSKKATSVKAALLDQSLFAGIGNWVADEVLYQSGIAPQRLCKKVTPAECKVLSSKIHQVLKHAVEVAADSEKYPRSWLFGVRWGGKKGAETADGEPIVRETVAGRTTAWVPTRQK